MGNVIVIEFVTLDGVVEDPDGSGGTPAGGWAFRHGPEAVAGDKFGLGPLLDTGVMLLGRAKDVVVTGSLGVVQTLAEHDLVDEHRLMVFPSVVGVGRRLFPDGCPPAELQLASVEHKGAGALLRYRRSR